jgi:hypothetical protein
MQKPPLTTAVVLSGTSAVGWVDKRIEWKESISARASDDQIAHSSLWPRLPGC